MTNEGSCGVLRLPGAEESPLGQRCRATRRSCPLDSCQWSWRWARAHSHYITCGLLRRLLLGLIFYHRLFGSLPHRCLFGGFLLCHCLYGGLLLCHHLLGGLLLHRLFSGLLFSVASSVAASAASFAAAALVATVVSRAAELPLDPLGIIARATTDEAGLSVGVAGGGPPAIDLPRPGALIDNQMSRIKYNYYISNVSKDYNDSQ
jgi:hypothetical protein